MTPANQAELRQHDRGGERRQEAPRGDDGGRRPSLASIWLDTDGLTWLPEIRIGRRALDDA